MINHGVVDNHIIVVFLYCQIETCRKVENVLRRLDRKASQIKVLPFHAALDQAQRIANIKEFLKKQTADSMFLVCTDRSLNCTLL